MMSARLTMTTSDKAPLVLILIRNNEDINDALLLPFKNILSQKLNIRENGSITFYIDDYILCVSILKELNLKTEGELREEARVLGGNITKKINYEKCDSILIKRASDSVSKNELLAYAEGISLNNYQFLKYKTEKNQNTLKNIYFNDSYISQEELDELNNIIDANELAKNLGNEPVISLNSVQLAEKVLEMSRLLNIKAEVLNKPQIEALRMGGLLGVNLGSSVPPTFTILEYHPSTAKNTKPLIFIGKGVTYDTGGYSIKAAGSMSGMKMDMCGAASIIGAFYAIVKNQLPVYCIGLIPSTDNRINSDALVPDDVITMHNGSTIEVLNTDAEGRLILGDALSYAKKYDPELVIDLATLTGAAAIITGTLGSAIMGTDTKYKNELINCGELTYERLWEIPYWKEYSDMLKSDVADMKNIGGAIGGSATAGKFLEHFTDYPWLHLDIAGPAILKEDEPYKQKGASGVGVRLLYAFAKKFAQLNSN